MLGEASVAQELRVDQPVSQFVARLSAECFVVEETASAKWQAVYEWFPQLFWKKIDKLVKRSL